MELVWLCIAIIAGISAVWTFNRGKTDSALFPLFVSFCALVLFSLRRYQRKRLEKLGEGTSQGKK
jgi:hypothetical protein